MTIVKICGLGSVEHAQAAVAAGASFLGFVFAPARRQVHPAQVVAIADAIDAMMLAQRPRFVGVFVHETIEQIQHIAQQCRLDVIQLSGDDDVQVAQAFVPRWMIFKTVRLGGAVSEEGWFRAVPHPSIRLLVDAQVTGSYGGAGVLADWGCAARFAQQHEVVLAGGLTPENVAEAIRCVQPWGVDVSSGVETDGVKDSVKIAAFVAAVDAVGQSRKMS